MTSLLPDRYERFTRRLNIRISHQPNPAAAAIANVKPHNACESVLGGASSKMADNSSVLPPIPEDNRILYFGRDRTAFRFLSHFWPSPFVLDHDIWPTVEHFYQAQKSFDVSYRAAIRGAARPGRAKQLAANPDGPKRQSKRSWFKKTGRHPRSDWDTAKLDIMRRADQAKFEQNADLAAWLVATGDAELVEDSPNEPFWGTGPDCNGLNWAGRILMEVRSELQQRI